MKIAILLAGTALGGAEKQAIIFGKEADKNGHNVIFYCIGNKEGLATDLLKNHGLKFKLIRPGIYVRYLHLINLVHLYLHVNFFKPEILYTYTTLANLYGGIIKCVYPKVRFIWGQRDEGLGLKNVHLYKLAASRADYFIANSKGGASFLVNSFDVNTDCLRIVPNGIQIPEVKKNSLNKYCLRSNDALPGYFVAMVANITKAKDHMTLINAWYIVIKSFPNAKLLLAGKFGNAYDELLLRIQHLGISSSVHFLGPIKDVNQLLAEVDLSILSSSSEGMSNSILESMAVRTPVLISDIQANRELLTFPESDYCLFNNADSFNLSNKIIQLLADLSLRKQIGDYCYSVIKQYYSIDNMYNSTIDVFYDR